MAKTFVAPEVISEDTVATINAGLGEIARTETGGTIRRWYHDMPVWLYVGPGYPQRWQVLQVSIVRDGFELQAEISSRTETIAGNELTVPRNLTHSRTVRLEALTVESFIEAVTDVWQAERAEPSMPPPDDQRTDGGFLRVPTEPHKIF